MDKTLHLALINQWYPPESHGGVAAHNYYLSKALAHLGHRVTVITSSRGSHPKHLKLQENLDIYRLPNIDLFRYRRLPVIGPHLRFVQALLRSKQAIRFLSKLHDTTSVDIVEFADVNAEGFFWHQGLGKRLIVRCQTPAFVLARYYTKKETPYNPVLLEWAEKRVIRRADLLLSPSNDMAETISEASNLPPDRFHIIPDALDTHLFSPDLSSKKSDTQINIVYVGRFDRVKGVEVLAEAIPLVCRKAPKVHFTLIGDDRPRVQGGSMRAYIQQKLKAHIDLGHVSIKGAVQQNELIETYRRAHIAVNPSLLYESFSYTCAQPMACRVAVVASNIAGIPETLDYGRVGMLVAPGDVSELVDALLHLCRDHTKREALAEAGRERAESHFNADIVAKRNVQVFRAFLEP